MCVLGEECMGGVLCVAKWRIIHRELGQTDREKPKLRGGETA